MDLYEEIPEHLKFKGKMNLPEPILDEYSIRRHVEGILNKNKNCSDHLNFLGAGCAQHFVPAVCDEINGRGEVLVPKTMNPEILVVMKTYLDGAPEPLVNIKTVDFDRATGLLDLDDLKSQLSSDTAAVFIENPAYLGVIETQAEEIGKLARDNGSEFIVFADPISLGVIAPPVHYGATIACGECHPLGIHMQAGGGQAGYIASLDDMEHASQFKDFVVSLADTVEEGEYGFGIVLPMNLSYLSREEAKEYTGTSAGLWAITAAVYLSLMGPKGMRELGQSIMQKAQYAAKRISGLEGVEVGLSAPFFKEFVVNFDETGKSVGDINKALLKKKIFGGKDISDEFPDLGQSALYCVTEIMTKDDIDTLVDALAQATR